MHTRYLLIASAALAVAGSAAAEPTKPEPRQTAPAPSRPAEVILASADHVQAAPQATPDQAATPAKKPRAARVTTCRCAGQVQN